MAVMLRGSHNGRRGFAVPKLPSICADTVGGLANAGVDSSFGCGVSRSSGRTGTCTGLAQ